MSQGRVLDVCKSSYARVAELAGLNAIERWLSRKSVVVLCYHGVISDEYGGHPLRTCNMVTTTEFQEQLSMLLQLYEPITASEFRRWLHLNQELPRKALLITFDDGYANNLHWAAPILNRFGVPAIFFITTSHVGSGCMLWPDEVFCRVCRWGEETLPLPLGRTDRFLLPEHSDRVKIANAIVESCKQMPMSTVRDYLRVLREGSTFPSSESPELFGSLDWDGVRALKRLGFEIGSHTVSHPILSQISSDQLFSELRDSKRMIEQNTDAPCFCMAYPNGRSCDLTNETAPAAREAGYEFAFTLMGGVCARSVDRMLLDRVWIPGNISACQFLTRASGVHATLKQLARVGRCPEPESPEAFTVRLPE